MPHRGGRALLNAWTGVALALGLSGCAEAPAQAAPGPKLTIVTSLVPGWLPAGFTRVRDMELGVTCWTACNQGCGLSCLPDAWLRDGGAP